MSINTIFANQSSPIPLALLDAALAALAGGSVNGISVFAGSTTLTSSNVGQLAAFSGAGGYTINAPQISSVTTGQIIVLGNGTIGNLTIVRQGSDQFATLQGNLIVTSFTMAPGDIIALYANTIYWQCIWANMAPRVTVIPSGSGTYTTPFPAKTLKTRFSGGGSGGNGTGTGATAGAVGGSTTFGSITVPGGQSGTTSPISFSGGDINILGAFGTLVSTAVNNTSGGNGASSQFGNGGAGNQPGFSGVGSNSPGAGGGGAGGAAGFSGGLGGQSGGYCEKTFNAPSATYAYSVGNAGGGGSAGTGGNAGGTGAAGLIIVEAQF